MTEVMYLFFSSSFWLRNGEHRIVSGTSALSNQVTELLTASLSVRITEGYGLTETCSSACLTLIDDAHIFDLGHVGPPLPCCEMKVCTIFFSSFEKLLPDPALELTIFAMMIVLLFFIFETHTHIAGGCWNDVHYSR